jgi:hypothetical protein
MRHTEILKFVVSPLSFRKNIGFDVRGDVKVFDFGLCKDLDPRLKAKDGAYGYRLTGRAGSLPYSKCAPSVSPRICVILEYEAAYTAFKQW